MAVILTVCKKKTNCVGLGGRNDYCAIKTKIMQESVKLSCNHQKRLLLSKEDDIFAYIRDELHKE